MAEILKVFTAEQLYELLKNKIVADNVGLTNFNEGSRIRSLLEAVAILESSTGFDYLDTLRKSIRVALYDGFGFARKSATYATGYIRYYRLPIFTMSYSGSGSTCRLTIDGTSLTTVCDGAPGDNFTLDFLTYPSASDIVTAIDGAVNYSASLVRESASTDLYHYTDIDILTRRNYLNAAGMDVLTTSATAILVPANTSVVVDELSFYTLADGTIQAGDASVIIAAQCSAMGKNGNIAVNAIDTRNGKGAISTSIIGADYAINDSVFSGGAEEETEQERLERFQLFIKGLTGATESAITAAVLGIEGIKSCTVRDNYPQRGQITVVADDGTGTLSPEKHTEILKVLNGDPLDYETYPGYRAAGITVNVTAPNVHVVDVTATIYRVGSISNETEIINSAKSAVETYINTRRLGQDVVVSEIIKVIKNSHAAIYDVAMTTPTTNISIDIDTVARTGSGTGGIVSITLITYPVEP